MCSFSRSWRGLQRSTGTTSTRRRCLRGIGVCDAWCTRYAATRSLGEEDKAAHDPFQPTGTCQHSMGACSARLTRCAIVSLGEGVHEAHELTQPALTCQHFVGVYDGFAMVGPHNVQLFAAWARNPTQHVTHSHLVATATASLSDTQPLTASARDASQHMIATRRTFQSERRAGHFCAQELVNTALARVSEQPLDHISAQEAASTAWAFATARCCC